MQVIIHDTGDLKRLARDLRDVADGKELRKELTGGTADILRPLVPDVRAAYRSMPSRGRARSASRADLRALLAKSVRVEVRTSGRTAGARIRADGRRMPDQMKALPAYVEGERARWRHPVFGDRAVWVTQAPSPRFYAARDAPHRQGQDGGGTGPRRRPTETGGRQMTDNGQVTDLEAVEAGPRRYLPTLLTSADMNRARTALAEVLGDRSAYDMLDDDYDRVPLTIWCLRSRTDPSFTWQQALETPYLAEWAEGEPGPPTIAAPPAGGANGAASAGSRKRTAPAGGPSSASTSG